MKIKTKKHTLNDSSIIRKVLLILKNAFSDLTSFGSTYKTFNEHRLINLY